MEADIPGGRSERGRLRLWSALPQKGGQSGTGHMNCSCHSKPFLRDPFPEQLQGKHSFGWACATQHVPKVFVSAQPALLRRNTLAVWPCCARGSFCAAKPPWAYLLQAAGSKFLWTESMKWPCWGWDVWEAEAVRLQGTSVYFSRKPLPSWRRKPV